MKKLISILLTAVISITCFSSVTFADNKKSNVSWPEEPNIASPSAIVIDASTGTILYGKNINDKYYPASTTKVLTGIIALENANLDEVVTFSHNAVYSLESGSTHIGIMENEQVKMEDCLYGLMLASANEVANGIAEHIGGSIDGFADIMNEYATNIGCTNSHFTNPSGLHNDEHYTTSHDLALIARYALRNEKFQEIVKTRLYRIPATNKIDEERVFSNHHQMLMGTKEGYTQYKYEDCIGGKTGYTSKARHALVTYGRRGDTTLVAVVMNTSVHDQYLDSTALLEYGFNNFSTYNISKAEGTSSLNSDDLELFNRYYNISNYEDSISIDSDSSVIIPNSVEFSSLRKEINYNTDIKLTEGKNNIGNVTYYYGDKVVGTSDINLNCTSESLTPILTMPDEMTSNNTDDEKKESGGFIKILKNIGIILICIVGIVLLFLLVLVIINEVRWRRRRKRRLSYDISSRRKRRNRHFSDFDL